MATPQQISEAEPGKAYFPVRVGMPSEEAETANKATKCPANDWTSRVPDGGWGWLVVGGSFIITSVMPLLNQGFGVVFSRYLLQEGSSSTTNAWLFNVHSFVWNMMGLMVRPLTQEFGWRPVAIAGVLLTFVALMLSAFTPSPLFLLFSFSLLSGMGAGLSVCMSFIIVPSYFDRRRGLANAVMMAGVCAGQMVGAPLLRLLQDEYGYRGATIILAAIVLNCCVGAAFYHPVEWHLKEPLQPAEPSWRDHEVKNSGDADCGAGEEAECVSLVAQTRNRSEDGNQRDSEELTNTKCRGHGQPEKDTLRQDVGLRALLARVMHSTVTDLTIMKSPRALIIAFGTTFFLNGYLNFIVMVPFAMQVAGHSLADAAYCISASAVANLVMRILASALSDYAWFNMRIVYMAGLATTATSIMVFPLLESVSWMMVAMTAWGMGVGTTMSFFSLIMVEFMGIENLAPTYGGTSVVLSIGFLTLGPLVGVIWDTSGSYSISMWVMSAYVFISFILWVFMPAAQAYDRRRIEAQEVALRHAE